MSEGFGQRPRSIVRIELDERSFLRRRPEVEHEREVALFDLLEENTFCLKGEGSCPGPYHLRLALREDPSGAARPVNAAVLVDPSGATRALYRKRKLFAYGGEHEHYAPGHEAVTITVEGVRVSLFICYDLRFPELFRAVAEETDLIALVANWPASRRAHWDVLVRARAIENLCYVAAVNRTGEGGGLQYDGGSAAYDPWGEPLLGAVPDADVRVVSVDPGRVAAVRARYPFLADREK